MWDHTDTSRQEIKHLLMLLMSQMLMKAGVCGENRDLIPTEEKKSCLLIIAPWCLGAATCPSLSDYPTCYELATTWLMLAAICLGFRVLSGPVGLV